MANQDLGELRTQLLKARFGNEEKKEKLLALERRVIVEGFQTISNLGLTVLVMLYSLDCHQKSGENPRNKTVYFFMDASDCIDIVPLLNYASEKTRRAYARIKYSK